MVPQARSNTTEVEHGRATPFPMLIPGQRGPSDTETFVREVAPPAPRRHRFLGWDAGCSRILLCGLLLFGALISELSEQPTEASGQSVSQHGKPVQDTPFTPR